MSPTHRAGQQASTSQIENWVEQFHRDGYLFLQNILPADLVSTLRTDLDAALTENPPEPGSIIELHPRMFERSRANLSLFDIEPIVSFAEALIADVTHGEPPKNIRLPVLLFTANYYLTDIEKIEHGPAEVIPGSHLFGASPPNPIEGTPYEDQVVSCLGPAGSVVMFNNQVWHRGGPNSSERTRYMAQISYARRLIGHKYSPFMNLSNARTRLRRRRRAPARIAGLFTRRSLRLGYITP
jgi:hypothetical protein